MPERDAHDPDQLLLASRIRERGIWTAEVRRDGDNLIVLAATIRIDVPGRAQDADPDDWVEAAADRVLAELRSAL